jgi:amino acid adenylation domain-containing protein
MTDSLGSTHIVIVNDQEQYSIWPAGRELPDGWRTVGARRTREACLDHIEQIWTDIRPRHARTASTPPTGSTSPAVPTGTSPSDLGSTSASARGSNPADADVVSRFLAHAAARPDAPAVVEDGAVLTYGQLETASAALASLLLRQYGMARDSAPIVAVLLPRGTAAVVAALGVQRAGAAHLPLEPRDPDDRLRLIAGNARPTCLITDQAGKKLAAEWGLPMVSVDEASAEVAPVDLSVPTPADWAAVIYTSGTTGTPRGVVVHHEGLAHLVAAHADHFGIDPGDRVGWATDMGFDISMWDVWSTLCAGATLYVVEDAIRLEPARLITWLDQHEISSMFLVTPLAAELMRRYDPPVTLRALITGGDRLWLVPPGRTRPWPVYNAYGPTEGTVVVTWTGLLAPTSTAPSLGRPLPGVVVHILDATGTPVAAGEVGEVAFSGPFVTLGYLRDLRRTAERWIPSPAGHGTRMYLTGDLGLLDADGELWFVGRADDQLKIRGIRIEPAEIVSAALALPGVTGAVAVPFGEPTDRAIGLVWTAEATDLDEAQLLTHLRSLLAAPVVPKRLRRVAELPRTTRGKIDYAQASELLAAIGDLTATAPAAVPADPVERLVAEIFADVLDVESPGPDDTFFAMGGTSMLAVRVLARLREHAPAFPMVRLYRQPTVREVAEALRELGAATPVH